jgi:hypothetical protein
MKTTTLIVLLLLSNSISSQVAVSNEKIILDEVKLGWATLKITAKAFDPNVMAKMLFVENAREGDVRLYKPEIYHGLIYQIGEIKIISGKYYQEPTTTTTTTSTTLPPVEYSGCCFEKTCLVDEKKCGGLGLKLDCNDDRICAVVGGGYE